MADELTGLLNRRSFNDRATEMIERANASGVGLTVITMLDLDNFKDVNDTLGHQVGDELIRAVGRRIMNRLPESAILARLGGDEFAIAANALDEAHAQRIIEEALGNTSRKPSRYTARICAFHFRRDRDRADPCGQCR